MYKKITAFFCGGQDSLFSQFFRIMKLSVILLLISFFQVNASAYAQKINLKKNEESLENVFKEIRKQSGYNIFYDAKAVKEVGRVSVNLSNANVDVAMQKCLEGTNLNYKIVDRNIIISKKPLKAQDVEVKGKVTDVDNKPIPGVNIRLKLGSKSTVTDEQGNYKMVVNGDNPILTFSFLGFVTEERKVTAGKTINVILKEKDNDLNEVVVTALNIKREEKALGYAVTTLKQESITDAVSNNWTDALSGKVAGLNLLRSNGGPAGSNRIILRGENSLSGNSEALVVIDGVVISSSSGRATGNGTAYMGDDSPTDYGTSINDINPNDIESVTVLKGPGATALYGARGAGGAIIITTKLANPKVKGIGVSISSNTSIESASRWPDYQYQYGQGDVGLEYYSYGRTEDGINTGATSNAFGPKFDGQMFYQFDPNTLTTGSQRTPWIAYPNNRKDFFETGQTYTNSVTIEGGTKVNSIRFGYTNLNNSWIIPNTGYQRNTFSLALNQKITNKLQLSGRAYYTNRSSDNLPSVGYNAQTIMYAMIRMVPNADLNMFKTLWYPGEEGIRQNKPLSQAGDNPYVIAYEMLNKSNRNTVTGYMQANYSFTEDLNLMLKGSIDLSYDSRSQQRPKDTRKYLNGMYRTQNIYNQEINLDFLLKYKKALSRKLDADLSLGGSILRNRYEKEETRAERLFAPNIFNFANSMDVPLSYPFRSQFGVSSLYGMASFGYDKFIYLDLTGRQDWSSTLFTPNGEPKGFFYPSANVSLVLNDKLSLPSYFSLLKFRGSYAMVGSGGTTPYLTTYNYATETNFPSGITNPLSVANANLKPESTRSVEFGADVRLFNGRLGLDVAWYQNNTTDQILNVPVDRASGYNYAVLNSGEVQNRGLEITVNGSPIKNAKKFSWNMFGTFTANRNKVLSLADSVEVLQLQSGPGGRGSLEARVGGTMGDLYGLGYERSPDGQIIYANGYPVKSQTVKWLANVYPKWKASFNNEFRYKQFRLNVLFDAQFGGKAYSHTHANNAMTGQLTSTLPGRYNGLVGDGVIQNPDGTFRKNDVPATEIWTYYLEHFIPDNVEGNLFSTDFIKFREARLDYVFTTKFLKKISLQKASIGIYGRDLLIISNWPSFDPEFGTINNGLIQSGFEIGQFPATRTFGFNLNVSF